MATKKNVRSGREGRSKYIYVLEWNCFREELYAIWLRD